MYSSYRNDIIGNSGLPLDSGLLAVPRWDDLRFPFTQTKLGALDKPDFDFTNLGLLFPQNDATEITYMIAQLQHSFKLGTDLKPHIHWVQSQATFPVWKIDYRVYKNNTDPTISFTTISINTGRFTYPGSGSILQISDFPVISGAGINDMSAMIDIKLYRDDNLVSGDVLAKEFDLHYQIDTPGGSRLEYTK